jgi:hypothetical protein
LNPVVIAASACVKPDARRERRVAAGRVNGAFGAPRCFASLNASALSRLIAFPRSPPVFGRPVRLSALLIR